MASLDDIILQEFNPFDPVTFVTGNFWVENHHSFRTVETIHQDAIQQISEQLNLVIQDPYHSTRSILLQGDRGTGKSYLLGRLKKQLNAKAFFVYIEPPYYNEQIWRHTLRYTVDSLTHKPEGEKKSQLLLWLKSLSAFKDKGLMKKLLGEKGLFIHNFSATYPAGIYQSHQFFGVLYELTQPENYVWACNWLKGDNLAEDQMKALGVNILIDSEEAARGILMNFGRIAQATKPIVLCFDQIELGSKLPNGKVDLSGSFHVNTTLHNNKLNNFLVIISVVTQSWQANKTTVPVSDLSRIPSQGIFLKHINLDQVQALWESRLYPLHQKADPKPESSLTPLTREELEQKYPGGKVILRESLNLGGQLFEAYKQQLIKKEDNNDDADDDNEDAIPTIPQTRPSLESFQLLWQNELKKTKNQVEKISFFAAPQLIDMLSKALKALEVSDIKSKLLQGHYANYSLSYHHPQDQQTMGIVWNEDPSMKTFIHAMKACEKVIKNNSCNSLFLLRQERFNNKKTKGYQIYKQLFQSKTNSHDHLVPSLADVQILRTYQRLANDAESAGIVVDFAIVDLPKLQQLVRESKVLEECKLLTKLCGKITDPPSPPSLPTEKIKQYLRNLITTQKMLGRVTLLENTQAQFSDVSESEIEKNIDNFCRTPFVTILNPKAKPAEQIICYNPKGSHQSS